MAARQLALPKWGPLRDNWLGNVKSDLIAGLVVAFALIPEAIAFSVIAGVDPEQIQRAREISAASRR